MQTHQQIEQWLKTIGQLIKQRIKEGLDVSIKTSLSDLVTNVDKEVEEEFCQFIAKHFPGHVVLGEESCHDVNCEEENIWVIDPIDGTLNFVKEQKNFAVMVAYYKNGVGQLGFIYDVMSNNCYTAIRNKGVFKNNMPLKTVPDLPLNQSIISISSNLFFLPENIKAKNVLKDAMSLRMVGSAGQSMLSVINGYYNGYFSVKLQPWDYLPGLIFADELGIVYTTLDNQPIELFKPTTMLFATPNVHHHIITALTTA